MHKPKAGGASVLASRNAATERRSEAPSGFIRVHPWLKIHEHARNPRPAPRIRIAQRPVHRTGRLMAHCLGARQRRERVGCRRQKISRSHRRLRRRRCRPREPARHQSRPATNGNAHARHGRRPPTRAQGRTRARTEPPHLRTLERRTSKKFQTPNRQNHFLQFRI